MLELMIKEEMEIVGGYAGELVAKVERIEAGELRCSDKDGVCHYIPLSWVQHVDDRVHLDRSCEEVVTQWTTKPD